MANRHKHPNNNKNSGESTIPFENFLAGWLTRQKDYLARLISTQNNFQNIPEPELTSLVTQVLAHYQQYYDAKAVATRNDVFAMFAPPWFSSYERMYLWITGFKPSLAFKILGKSVNQDELTDEQLEALYRLKVWTKAAERNLNDKMAGVQESWVLPPFVNLALRNPSGRCGGGGDDETADAAIQTVKKEMESAVESADFVRMAVAEKIVEILSPAQGVRFLAAATQFQVNIRTVGQQRDAKRGQGVTRKEGHSE